MTKRDDYVERIESALGEMRVKAHLARLEAHDLRDELGRRYEHLRDRLHRLGEAAGDRWEGLREGVEAAWDEFRETYRRVLDREAKDEIARAKHGDTTAPRKR